MSACFNINSAGQFEGAFKDFVKRLDDYCISDVNTYLETVQNSIRDNQNDATVSNCLVMIEEAVRRKKCQIEELQKSINGKNLDSDYDNWGN